MRQMMIAVGIGSKREFAYVILLATPGAVIDRLPASGVPNDDLPLPNAATIHRLEQFYG
jgi:hypothetical protein